ncbi:MAG: hypothetical protein A3H29_13570 [Acidobacteria bacterium RIFCSPLOWO2_02_FULL_67_21]|nr:MAG: hypothetical protein A3H29_13570 [Acidobacteria bacterium RIFCSPLOWO2_02_FULL_67_21]
MRKLIALPIVLVIVVAAASGRYAGQEPRVRETVRVATYNIHKGADRRGRYHLDRTIETMARSGADVIGAQEVMRNHLETGCADQPALIAAGLRQRTGDAWTYVHKPAWIYERRDCLASGRGDGVETEDLVIFSRERILWSDWVRLGEGRIGLAVRVAGLPDTSIVVTHLSPNRSGQEDRARELEVLLPWAAKQRAGVLMGDLNAVANAPELAPVFARYRDAWPAAAARGRIDGVPTGSTRPNRVSRIDYVLTAPDFTLTLDTVTVIDTATLGLGEVSDHHPVVATFRRTTSTQ